MTAVESIAPVLSFLPPEEIRIFSFPFDQPGNTSENPLSLPDEYQEVITSNCEVELNYISVRSFAFILGS